MTIAETKKIARLLKESEGGVKRKKIGSAAAILVYHYVTCPKNIEFVKWKNTTKLHCETKNLGSEFSDCEELGIELVKIL